MATTTSFESERAPCGRVVSGQHFRDQDDEGLILDHLHYACGCQSIRTVYHDGSVHSRVVRHDGKVVVDELSEHGA
jgi:hypothetical protein